MSFSHGSDDIIHSMVNLILESIFDLDSALVAEPLAAVAGMIAGGQLDRQL